MAELKTRPDGQSVKRFLNDIPDKTKHDDCFTLLDLMKQVTRAEPNRPLSHHAAGLSR